MKVLTKEGRSTAVSQGRFLTREMARKIDLASRLMINQDWQMRQIRALDRCLDMILKSVQGSKMFESGATKAEAIELLSSPFLQCMIKNLGQVKIFKN